MNRSRKSDSQRSIYLTLVITTLFLGAIGIYFGSHNFAVRSCGIAAILASTYCIRRLHLRRRSDSFGANDHAMIEEDSAGPGRALWILSISLVPVLLLAFLLLNSDAASGGHTAWPADLFAGVGIVCAVVWGVLVMRIIGGRPSRSSR